MKPPLALSQRYRRMEYRVNVLHRRPRPASPVPLERRGGRIARPAQPAPRSTRRQRLVVFVKEPAAGRVKTRLARGLGVARATGFYRHATRTTLTRLAADPRWQTVLAVAPDAALASRAWPAGIERGGQGGGDLGARMQRIMNGMPVGPVIIIGTDIPTIRPSHIAAAFMRLGSDDAVFGPAPDGGYWLVGLRRARAFTGVFRNVRWSTADTFADTRRNLDGLRVALIDPLGDIDEVADFKAAGSAVGRLVPPAP